MIPPCPSTSQDGYPPHHPYTPRWHSPMTMIPPCPSTSRDGYPLTIPTPHGGILPWLWYHHVPVPPEMVTPPPSLHPMVAFSHDYDTTMSQYLPRWLPPLPFLHPMVAFSHDYDTTMYQYLPRWLPPHHPYTPWWHSPMTMIPPCPSTSRDGYPPYHPYIPWWHCPMTMIPPCPSTSRDGYPLTIPTPHGDILPWLWYHHVPVPPEMVTPLPYLHPMVTFSHDYDTTMSQYLPRWLPSLPSLHPMVAFSHDYDTQKRQQAASFPSQKHPVKKNNCRLLVQAILPGCLTGCPQRAIHQLTHQLAMGCL